MEKRVVTTITFDSLDFNYQTQQYFVKSSQSDKKFHVNHSNESIQTILLHYALLTYRNYKTMMLQQNVS